MPARRREKGQSWKRHSLCVPQGGRNEWVSSREGKLEKPVPHIPSLGRKKAEVSVDAHAPQHVNFPLVQLGGKSPLMRLKPEEPGRVSGAGPLRIF